MGRELVVVDKVEKVFAHEEQDVSVLKGIDLIIEEGEMLCVVGRSGAGKSTLLHLLGTLDLPTSGRILYDGVDVTSFPGARLAEFRNRTIGFVFQFHHLLPEFSALENVMMPGFIRGESHGSLAKRATALLEEVGLAHRLTHRPGELSGGEQQRVALARALVMEPRLILADEPTGNLDTKTSDAIHKLFFELNQRRGTTFLIVTHSRDLAARMPRVVSMKDGVIDKDHRRPDVAGRPFRTADPDLDGDESDARVEAKERDPERQEREQELEASSEGSSGPSSEPPASDEKTSDRAEQDGTGA